MPKRFLIWGTFDTGKPRVRMLVEAIRLTDDSAQVFQCSPWDGVEDKSCLGKIARIGILFRWLFAYPRLIIDYMRAPPHDVIVILYPGNLDVIVLWLFARLRGVPICWDMFISAYDTAVIDRGMLPQNSLRARLLFALEWLSARLADMILLDTAEHAQYVAQLYRLTPGKVRAVWVGAETGVFCRIAHAPPVDPVEVLFYGQFIPLHGLPVIVAAIDLIERRSGVPPLHFTIIGIGQEQAVIDAMIAERKLTGITRINWLDYRSLSARIASSSICLGVFADGGKAARVIPNKVFQILAVGRPLVTMDSPAIREILQPGVSVKLVTPGDAAELAQAIVDLASALRAPGGAAAMQEAAETEMPQIGLEVIRQQFAQVMTAL